MEVNMTNVNIPDEQKIYELSLIWKEAEYNFAFWEWHVKSLDWDNAYKEALPTILQTKSLHEYYRELMKFVALLRDGHTRVWLPKELDESPQYTSKLPIITQLIKGQRVITNVNRTVADKVKQWSVIKKVDGLIMEDYAKKFIYPYIWHEKKDSADFWIDPFLRNGAEGSEVTLELEHEGITETVTLTRTKDDNDWFYNNTVSKSSENFNQTYQSDSHKIAMTDDNIAIITIDSMMNDNLPSEFYANFHILEKAKGYVIDVRNNGGGSSNNSDAVAAAFIEGDFVNQRSLHPIHIGAYKAWGRSMGFHNKTYEQVVAERGSSEWMEKTYKITNRQYYENTTSTSNDYNCPGVLTAPLVLLSSCNTASAAEDFLVELDCSNRATIVGSASFGSTGNPLTFNLESGGGFAICTRHNLYPDGREFINVGVKPHIPIEMTLDEYKNGVDSVMNKGLEVVRGLINRK